MPANQWVICQASLGAFPGIIKQLLHPLVSYSKGDKVTFTHTFYKAKTTLKKKKINLGTKELILENALNQNNSLCCKVWINDTLLPHKHRFTEWIVLRQVTAKIQTLSQTALKKKVGLYHVTLSVSVNPCACSFPCRYLTNKVKGKQG